MAAGLIVSACIPASAGIAARPRYIVSNGIVGVCLAASPAGGHATGSPCPGGHGAPPVATEEWAREGRLLVSTSGRCLTAGRLGGLAWSSRCRGLARQHWRPVTFPPTGAATELRNGDGRCLDIPRSYFGDLRLSRCNNGDNTENWFFTARS
jgi:hypothetical protein